MRISSITKLGSFLLLATLPTLILSCSSSGSKGNSESITSDSLNDLTAEEQLTVLPDTMYESAKIVDFYIERADSSSGELNDLSDLYKATPGSFTFRKNAFRDADYYGRVKGRPTKINIVWEFTTGNPSTARWGGGSGWTGQPVIVIWPDSLIEKMRSAPGTLPEFGRKEVMVGSLAGRVYFLNFDTGKPSREPIEETNPIKGSISLDPTLNGNLYVGQGIPAQRPFGALVIDLYKHTITDFTPEDSKAPRAWGAYDSSQIRAGQFLFRAGENGRLYKFIVQRGKVKLHTATGYRVNGSGPGMEASLSIYRNYGYVSDNDGNLICFNLNTMTPVWHYATGDDTDCSPVICIENGKTYVYTGSEIDHQISGTARYAKLDALTGKPIWERKIPGKRFDTGVTTGTKHFDGGFYGTSLPGRGNCSGLIFDYCVYNMNGQDGELIAFDRKSGKTVWQTKTKHYAWSSPVGFLNEKNELFIVQFDCAGNVYLIEGKTGEILYTACVGANFESSPAVIGNELVVGSRGNKIMKFRVE